MGIDQVHVYSSETDADSGKSVVLGLKGLLPNLSIDGRAPFKTHCKISDYAYLCDSSKIKDVKQPFERHSSKANDSRLLYDGFVLQDMLRSHIPNSERDIGQLHIVLTNLLVCTFDVDDWRYHARPIVCGTPNLLSLPGIVEGPARPREYYLASMFGRKNRVQLDREFAGRFIAYQDARLYAAALGYAVQAIFYFITDGKPFCEDSGCRLHNTHWQEELISAQVSNPVFCKLHLDMLNKFNSTQNEN